MALQSRGAPSAAAAEPDEVTLREFTASDAEAFMSWASDPRVARFQRRDAFTHVDQARRYITDHVLPHPWYRAICLVGSDGVVGRPWVGPRRRLEAVADVENPASQRVLEKAGFVRDSVLRKYIMLKGRPRDMVMFSIVVHTDRRRQQNEPRGVRRQALIY
ncbi:hypothetical protein PR202_gb11494 [Eleusine coracana subsp. coracana]|uniref:N-acetyltransferase domain-containing protein n=1 Tax=Eleusine coracana subsp. coracana TaxID=191504 RepID=A0AAV5EMQ1_ELECO|nr:hypothetical protein PR202_gb11494 [Eleusine coracana subsp. coracana]